MSREACYSKGRNREENMNDLGGTSSEVEHRRDPKFKP
jgi:hypothetical protein